MELEEVKQNLESLYIDYFDALYSEHQLKMMLLKLYKQSKITDIKWSELILDAQWKYATAEDYNVKIKQLAEQNKEDGN
jgi:hypothetical protein